MQTTRRTIVKGAAWSVPVVAMAAPAAMAACTPPTDDPTCKPCQPVVSYSGDSCKEPGSTNDFTYHLGFCFNASQCLEGQPTPEEGNVVIVTSITNNAKKPFTPSAAGQTLTLGPGGQACLPTRTYTSTSSAGTVVITYTLNGQTFVAELPAPPDCTGVTTTQATTATTTEAPAATATEAPATEAPAGTDSAATTANP